MSRWFVLVTLVACACPPKPGTGPGATSPGTGTAVTPTTGATSCADVRARIEALYRAEAQQREPKRVDEAVADNTAMVMTDCGRDPARSVPCIAKAASAGELEQQCLVPLDEEGTEGDR